MEQHLVQQVNATPDALAVIENDTKLSYRQLIARADILAQALEDRAIKSAEPVCIFLSPGPQQVVAQVAVLRAGGSCVPIEPSVPSLCVTSMLRDVNSRFVIANAGSKDKLPGFEVIPVESAFEKAISVFADSRISVRTGFSEAHRTHLLFTSGSTGRPKPIQILARGILHVARHFPGSTLGPNDRMSSFINPGFDLSLFEVWMSLLSGAAVVRVPKVIMTDPLALKGFLDEKRITAMMVPTALFNVIAQIAPTTFRGRSHVLVGGEAVNASAMRKVLTNGPPGNLWNAYGPTETTIYTTLCLVDLEETQRSRVSIWRPLGHTKVYLLNEQRSPIHAIGELGEICVSGPQVSAGYLNMPEETEERFINIDAGTLGEESGTSVCLYRTGDLGQWRDKSGLLDYIGRVDKQIKRFGHRVELGDIERTLETHPHVHSCVVNQHKKDTSDVLAAYVVPEVGAEWSELDDSLISWARARLPPYMVPDLVQKQQEFPLSANGKVDRKALVPETRKNPGGKAPNSVVNGEKHDLANGEKHDWLLSKLQEYLDVADISPNDDLFSLGLSSLQSAQLLGDIMQHGGKKVTMGQLHANPTLGGLRALLYSSSKLEINDPTQTLRWEEDSHMADDIVSPHDWQAPGEGRVFLTGATGFLGAHLLHDLLCMPTVKQVACLARSSGKLTANNRIQKALEKYGLWDGCLEKMQKIVTLEGEFEGNTLGLAKDQFDWLANWASVVFHVGARVNWCEPYEAHYMPNVVGTRNIIRLTVQGRRKTLHYISSIDTWNVTGLLNKVERVLEDESLRPHLGSLPYDIGYAQSQWVADEMVQRARSRGLPAVIYRPGFVIGHSSRATGNPDDFFARMIIGCIQCGYFPYLPRQRLEWVTVDYVCSALLHIASKADSLGRSYHLVPPDPTRSVSMESTCKLLNQAGHPVKQIPYHDWVEKIRQSPGNPMAPMVPLLQERILGDLSRMQTSTFTPIYDVKNTIRALADRPDIQYLPLDAPLLQSYVDFWVKRGDYSLCRESNGY